MEADQISALGDRTRRLAALRKHEGWNELKSIHVERKQKVEANWLRLLWDGKPLEKLDYERGFIEGIDYLINAADHADRTFENALKRHLKGQ